MKALLWPGLHLLAVLTSMIIPTSQVGAEEPVLIKERFPVGYQYHVNAKVDLTGSLTPPAEKGKTASKALTVKGEGTIEYDERVMQVASDGQVRKTMRICRRTEIKRTVGDQPQEATLRSSCSHQRWPASYPKSRSVQATTGTRRPPPWRN